MEDNQLKERQETKENIEYLVSTFHFPFFDSLKNVFDGEEGTDRTVSEEL